MNPISTQKKPHKEIDHKEIDLSIPQEYANMFPVYGGRECNGKDAKELWPDGTYQWISSNDVLADLRIVKIGKNLYWINHGRFAFMEPVDDNFSLGYYLRFEHA